MKKLFALLMAVTLTFQLVTPVFAEDTEQANIDTLPQETEVLVDETKGPDETEDPAETEEPTEADAPTAATETDKTGAAETVPTEVEPSEESSALIRVTFIRTPADLTLTVYAEDTVTEIDPQEDDTYLLAPGEYTYLAELDGYISEENTFTVSEVDEANCEISVELQSADMEDDASFDSGDYSLQLSRIDELYERIKKNGGFFTVNKQPCISGSGHRKCDNCKLINVINSRWFSDEFGPSITCKKFARNQTGEAWTCNSFATFAGWFVNRETDNDAVETASRTPGSFSFDFFSSNAQPGDSLYMSKPYIGQDGKEHLKEHFAIFISCNEQGVYVLDGNNTGRACEVAKQTIPYSRYTSVTISHLQSKQGGHTQQTAPAAPTNFKAVYVDNERAKLSWSASSGATSYEVQYWSVGSNAWKTDTSYGSGTSYTSTGLRNYSSWTFRVRAVNSAGKSDWVSCNYEKTHTHSYKQEFEAAHPHKAYMKCSSCGDWYYTGATTTVDSCTQCHPPVQQVYLDLKGYLDGRDSDSLENFGTCDVYINGKKVADDCADFYQAFPIGTTYSIEDIRATDGHKYIGEKGESFKDNSGGTVVWFSNLSGTLNKKTEVVLEFETAAPIQVSLKLKACLNDEEIDSLDGIATCDVYINGEKVADGCSQFDAAYPVGSTYSIRNVSTQRGYRFKGVLPKHVDTAGNTTIYFGSLEGTLTDNSEVVLDFEATGHSGTCGDNLTWSLNTAGTLTITGTGAMWNYEWCQDGDTVYSSAPWAGLEITDIALDEGITRIGNCAFLDCRTIFAPLSLPSTLQEIGDAAFSGCYGLYGELYLPESINAIGACAFQGCEGLTGALNLPSGVSYIGSAVFNGCSGLTGTISIPKNVQYIGDWAFRDCIGFTGKLVVPSNVIVIDEYAFAGCAGIEQAEIPADLQLIGEGAFEDCASLADVYYAGSLTQWNQISIGANNAPLLNATLHCTDSDDIDPRPLAQSVTLWLDGEAAPKSATIDLNDYPHEMPQLSLTATVLPEEAVQSVTWSSSAPKVATVEEDGRVTVVSPGTAVIKAIATDGSKKTAQISLNVIRTDRSPRLGTSTLTLNGVSTAGVQVDLVETYGNRIQNVRVDDDRLGAEYEDNVLTLYAREAIAKGTCKVVLTADTDGGTYTYPLTIKVTQALPKLTVKQSNKFDLFYRDSESTLTITGGEVESAAFIGSSDFALENEDDQWFIRYADPENIPAKPGTKVTLSVLFAGYNAPVTKSVTIATVNTSPKLKLSPASSVLNTVLTEALEVRAQLAGTDDDNLSVWTDTPGAEVYLDDGTLTIGLSAAKAVTVNVYVQSDSWAKPVKLTHKVSVTTKKPTLKAVNSTLKLNSYFPSETASIGLILSQGNLSLSTVELTPTAKAGAAATESEKLSVSYDLDSEEIVAEILDSSIKNGTYSFTCVGTLEDGTAISGGTVKVSVTNTLPKAKLSASTVKLNRRLTGEEATVKVTLTGGNGYTVTGFENLPDFMWYEDGILTVTLPEQSGTYPLYATVSRGGEEAVLPTAVKLTVQVYDKVPSFRLSAKGKLDVLNPDSEIIYTPKLTNALGTATDVELTGASADLFDAEVVNGTIHLTLAKSGDNYSTKATYKIVPLLTICDQQVKGPTLSIKVTQSALKLASLPNRTVYTSQATPLLQTLHVTAPAAAEIGDVTLNAKTSAALRSALDTAGGLQSRGATIAFPAKAFTGLKPGNYTVILDIIPVNAASDSKPTQAKFTLTVKK